jgi:beta-glucosidase
MIRSEREIIFLDPVFTHNIWGGVRLREEFGYNVTGEDIGECWGISAHPHGDVTVRGGRYSGMKLSELYASHRELFGNIDCDSFPLLAKIIDAKEDLSIQVHPDDDYAKKNENGSSGKTESWYIIDCPENATLVLGHNAKTKDELVSMIERGRWSDLIREVPVKKGDFIQIDPGTVHAIKGGIMLMETQQSCDLTYRLYDYNRLSNGKPRELHIDKSIDVITVPAAEADSVIKHDENRPVNRLNLLHECDYYSVYEMESEIEASFEQEFPFFMVSVIEGAGEIDGVGIKKGDHFILPDGYGRVDLKGNLRFIGSTVRK